MDFMEWDDRLITGNATIDGQHRKLVSLVNDLHAAMRAGKGSAAVAGVLAELAAYTAYHFSTEEKAFERYGYDRGAEHKRHHDELIAEVGALKAKVDGNEIGVSVKVLDFLVGWVKNHILKEDMLYLPLLRDKDLSPLA